MEWTKIDDGLPPKRLSHKGTEWRDPYWESERVLCVCKQNTGRTLVKEGYCKVWEDGRIRWMIPGEIHEVTHWGLLPEPPID